MQKKYWKKYQKRKREKEEIASKESNADRKAKFFSGLRQFSDELNLINEIRDNPSKLYDMNIEELNNVQQVIMKRQEFVNQRILELKQQRAKNSENI